MAHIFLHMWFSVWSPQVNPQVKPMGLHVDTYHTQSHWFHMGTFMAVTHYNTKTFPKPPCFKCAGTCLPHIVTCEIHNLSSPLSPISLTRRDMAALPHILSPVLLKVKRVLLCEADLKPFSEMKVCFSHNFSLQFWCRSGSRGGFFCFHFL